ncbi:MAG: hypothetical protein HRU31_01775 [Rhodobacteraceae bacterium]|nr:hypothetical protein [Paracoccaceae bacterium]
MLDRFQFPIDDRPESAADIERQEGSGRCSAVSFGDPSSVHVIFAIIKVDDDTGLRVLRQQTGLGKDAKTAKHLNMRGALRQTIENCFPQRRRHHHEFAPWQKG